MKKTLKLLVPLLIGAAFAFSFASCSSDDGDGGNQQYYDDNSWDKNVDLFVGYKNLGTNWDSDLALILDGALFSNCNSSDKFTLDFEFESADYYKLKICANIDDWPELKSIVLPAGMYLDEYYGDFAVNSSPLTFSLNSSDLTAIKQSGMVIQGHGVTIKKVSYQPSNSSGNGNNNSGGNNGNSFDPSDLGNGSSNGENSGSEDTTESGLYIGMLYFGCEAEYLNNGKFICLNADSKKKYVKDLLNDGYKVANDIGTLMYYGVHKALVNLEKNSEQLPENLENVYIITFTDGLDNSSDAMKEDNPLEEGTDLDKYATMDEYAAWLKAQLEKRKIKGKNIVCYSVGVKGSDALTIKDDVFKKQLENVASSSENAKILINFDELQNYFKKLTENLTVTTYKYDFTLRLPTKASSVEAIGITFDIPEQRKESAKMSESKVYLKGKVNRNFGTDIYTLTIEDCKGIMPYSFSITGKRVTEIKDGKKQAPKLVFSLEDITCEDPSDSSFISSWLESSLCWYSDENGDWSCESEYLSKDSKAENTTHSSAAIYLVLDNSISLIKNVEEVKSAVSNFIDELYSKLNLTN